ncbi:hypothetical protein CgunFtcFv8_018199 [Champsocephalus gunnari]|uniref:Uncharacterized protein n=1 Tax=Champsocephalus gunnari TaxID=52237 RepID=A0AAN8DUH8_CHAGU|nr:hypothetical protein CgunFtcFv8_018199 [Champsocephalus gunnari]
MEESTSSNLPTETLNLQPSFGAWDTPGRNHKPANARKRMRMLKRPRHQGQREEQTVPSTPGHTNNQC